MQKTETNRVDVMPCGWAELAPHHRRGALFIAAPDLDLLDVVQALADDRADRVKAWLTVGRLGRPTQALIESWGSARFQLVVVQPFVVAQLLNLDRAAVTHLDD